MQTQSLIPSFEDIKLHSADGVATGAIEQLSDEIKAIETLANPLKCDEKYLPFLAYAFKVDFWDDNLTQNDKRRLIQSSLLLHQRKGTVWALERIFESLGMDAKVSEWFNYNGEPYHFKVDVEIGDITKKISKELIVDLKSYVEIYKNIRSVLDEINIRLPIALGKLELAIGSTIDISFSNKTIFENIKSCIVLEYGACTNIALSNSDVIKQSSDVAIFMQSATTTTANLVTNDVIKQSSDLNFKLNKGGVIDVKLKNNPNYQNKVGVDMKITGGVVWAF